MPDLHLTSGGSHAPTLFELFVGFSQMSLSGFGGVLPFARSTIVEDRGWMTPHEFNETLALCQFLPGPNIVNFSVMFGSRVHGVAGAVVALFGLLGPPIAIVLMLGLLYRRFGELEALSRVLGGVAAAASGLVVAVAIKMAQPMRRGRFWPAPLIAAVALLSVGVAGVPLPLLVLVLAPVSIALAWVLER
jgi:chromate transporter